MGGSGATYDPAGDVVDVCRDLIRIDTTNHGDQDGPGERKAAEHVAALLDEVGIDAELHESEPGRTSVVAHWGPTGGQPGADKEPILLHGHLDVVPARAEDWTHDPFGAEVVDGQVWGRGAVDMKDFDAMVLSVVRARTLAGVLPERPVVLCFTADEEAGGAKGAGWLARHQRDHFAGCTVAIGEVGGFSATVRGRRLYLIEAAEKGMAWLRLTARGNAGHGSMRHPDNAVNRLAAAVARIGAHEWPVQLTPTMEVLLAAVADLAGTEATPENAEALVEEFGPAARMLGAVIRNTANPTRLEAGYKVNVVPGEALGWIDGRFLPGHDDDFAETLARLAGPDVELDYETRMPAVETSYDGWAADAITAALLEEDPDALVAPYLMSGGTDAKYWAALGMKCFGFSPLRLPPELDFTALFHGVDERVPVDALEFGARVLDRFLARI
jgi:acetylornithine deacetylase/succinyl-diaminopimelate desuccinylase-like protein